MQAGWWQRSNMDYSCRTYQLLGAHTSTRTTNKTESTSMLCPLCCIRAYHMFCTWYAVADCDRSYVHSVIRVVWWRVSSYVINHCRNVLAFIIQVENEFGSVNWSTPDSYCETITRQKLFAGNLVVAFVMGIFLSSQVLQALQGRSHRCFRSSDTANWF